MPMYSTRAHSSFCGNDALRISKPDAAVQMATDPNNTTNAVTPRPRRRPPSTATTTQITDAAKSGSAYGVQYQTMEVPESVCLRREYPRSIPNASRRYRLAWISQRVTGALATNASQRLGDFPWSHEPGASG